MPVTKANDIQAGASELRARVAKLRQQLLEATDAYRNAVARHDSRNVIPLLRSRSQLMRELLNTQCELLLTLRSPAPATQAEVFEEQVVTA
jgi:hypothetical protein